MKKGKLIIGTTVMCSVTPRRTVGTIKDLMGEVARVEFTSRKSGKTYVESIHTSLLERIKGKR